MPGMRYFAVLLNLLFCAVGTKGFLFTNVGTKQSGSQKALIQKLQNP